MEYEIVRLKTDEQGYFEQALECFATAFEEIETYLSNRPSKAYLSSLLSDEGFIFLVAIETGKVIGALAAYELKKFEQERSEIYIYDLAVNEKHRQKGIATALIAQLKPIAKKLNAWVIYVQADYEDQPAVNLYTKLGTAEEVLHFDIPVKNHP